MSADQSLKLQTVLWWITSIAISVLCCSILFVLFASYLVEIKADIRDTETRLHMIEDRENVLLTELQAIHKQIMPPAVPVVIPEAAAPTLAPATTDSASPTEIVPTAPVAAPAAAPVINVPTVPATPTPSSK